jgi:sugar lactone lactonase YvrE
VVSELKSQRLAEGIIFGEGPRWHDGKLWLSDMYGGWIKTVDAGGRVENVVEVPGRPSGLGWLPDGRMLVVSMAERKVMRHEDGSLVVHADLSGLVGGDCNDMVVDGRGRAYVGNFGFDLASGGQPGPTNIVMVSPDGAASEAASGLMFPNGTVISPDSATLIVAETFGAKLTALDIAADGSLGNPRLFADLAGRTPDGICLDAEGAVWASCFNQDEFVRALPGGEITHRVDVSGRRAVACMLGGSDRQTLFLLTADTDMTRLPQGDSNGFVETVQVQTPGAGWP